MPTYDIVVFPGDYCGPEVSCCYRLPRDNSGKGTRLTPIYLLQVTAEAVKVRKAPFYHLRLYVHGASFVSQQ